MIETRLSAMLSKCELITRRVQYLVFAVEPLRVSPDSGKVSTVKNWPVELTDRRQLRGFLGISGYYRRLIPDSNNGPCPLYEILRDGHMVWWPKHSCAVQQSKDALAEHTLLRVYDPHKPVAFMTDASKCAVGAVLEQEGYRSLSNRVN